MKTTTHKVMRRERVGMVEIEYTISEGYKPRPFTIYIARAYQLHDMGGGRVMNGVAIYTRIAADQEDGFRKFEELRDLAAAHQLAEALGLTPLQARSDVSTLVSAEGPEPFARQ